LKKPTRAKVVDRRKGMEATRTTYRAGGSRNEKQFGKSGDGACRDAFHGAVLILVSGGENAPRVKRKEGNTE